MGVRRSKVWRIWCGLALIPVLMVCAAVAAQPERSLATVDKPAVVATTPPTEAANKNRRLILTVTGFQPPESGAVQVVVDARTAAGGQEIGRFGIFPNAPFTASEPSRGQRFGLPWPSELAGLDHSVTLNVHLVPLRGTGEGARLEVGAAAIQ